MYKGFNVELEGSSFENNNLLYKEISYRKVELVGELNTFAKNNLL